MARSGTSIKIKKRDGTYTNYATFSSKYETVQTLLDTSIATDNGVTEVSLTEGGAALDHSLTLEGLGFDDLDTYIVYDVTPVPDPTLYIHNSRIRR